ncbi:MAG TPA: type IV toxin-antitoxin system AbiEi family antitoxin domain-containing protein [Thermoleophilaceae bacterium]
MSPQGRTVEEKIAGIASRRWGVVTWAELRRAGLSPDQIRWRVRIGSLIRVHRGVYRVGHRAPCTEATYLAAVKACGEDAVLSGRAAAYLQGLLPKCNPPAPEATAPTERKIAGVRTRRRRLDRRDVTRLRGIPITTAPRTLVDLAAVLGLNDLARACHEAGVRYRTTPRQVEEVLRRSPNARGAKKLRTVMHGEAKVTLSRLERRFLKLLSDAVLPLPETNRPAGGRRVDCRWPDHHLTVELDSYTYHSSRRAWEQDRRREREAYARRDQFRRYTWGDVFEDTRPMLSELRELLATRAGGRPHRT